MKVAGVKVTPAMQNGALVVGGVVVLCAIYGTANPLELVTVLHEVITGTYVDDSAGFSQGWRFQAKKRAWNGRPIRDLELDELVHERPPA